MNEAEYSGSKCPSCGSPDPNAFVFAGTPPPGWRCYDPFHGGVIDECRFCGGQFSHNLAEEIVNAIDHRGAVHGWNSKDWKKLIESVLNRDAHGIARGQR